MKTFITLAILLVSICSMQAQVQDTSKLESISQPDTVSITYIETTTQFPGGHVEFYKYVFKNLNYPLDAKAAGIGGKVILSFEILADGTVNKNSITIDRSSSELLNKEAIRLISNSPSWIAATIAKEGEKPKSIKSRISLAIPFRLKN